MRPAPPLHVSSDEVRTCLVCALASQLQVWLWVTIFRMAVIAICNTCVRVCAYVGMRVGMQVLA